MGSENEMVAVPVEPTEAMIAAGEACLLMSGSYDFGEELKEAWAAMVEAARLAPAQPDAQQGEVVGYQLLMGDGRWTRTLYTAEEAAQAVAEPNNTISASRPVCLATPSSPALDAATIERCAQVVINWPSKLFGDEQLDRRVDADRYDIAAAIRALPNAEKRHG